MAILIANIFGAINAADVTFTTDTLENFTKIYWMNFFSFWMDIYDLKVEIFKQLTNEKKMTLQFFLHTAQEYIRTVADIGKGPRGHAPYLW